MDDYDLVPTMHAFVARIVNKKQNNNNNNINNKSFYQ